MKKLMYFAAALLVLVSCSHPLEEGEVATFPELEVKAVPQEVSWTKFLSLGRDVATAIVIETGKDVSSYTEDGAHQALNDDKTLWAYLDGTTLHIQTPASKINSILAGIFANYSAVVSISGLQYIHATTAMYMFSHCEALTSLDLSGFNTENVEYMSGMFYNCKALTSLDLSGFNTAKVTDMSGMFYNCYGLISIKLSDLNTANVTNMSKMFGGCNALTSLDLSGFNTAKVTDMREMFDNCWKLESLTLSNNFKVAGEKTSMFNCCGRDVVGGCTVKGVTVFDIRAALMDGTGWNNDWMYFD